VLQNALGRLAEQYPENPKWCAIHHIIVNPKSITLGQLYGEFDKNTHEWRDGILAHVVRLCSRAEGTDLHWIVLDGPVDALWVENLNTVRQRGVCRTHALID
jgi:dynein heavy chain